MSKKDDENNRRIFSLIYLLMENNRNVGTWQKYFAGMVPFIYKERADHNNAQFNRAKRLLIEYWDNNDSLGNHQTAINRFIEEMNDIKPDTVQFKKIYSNNPVINALKTDETIGPQIIELLQEAINDKRIDTISINLLNEYLDSKDYATFLYYLVRMAFDKSFNQAEPPTTNIGELHGILKKYNADLGQLTTYVQSSVFQMGTNGPYGVLDIFSQAGFPDRINKKCNPFILLKASDIYYYHRFNEFDAKRDKSRDIEYSYRYSEAAFQEWKSPLAAWNMGYTWYLHEQIDPFNNTRIEIPEFSTIEASEESYLIKAMESFSFAARYSVADGYNSIGNICAKILQYIDEYPKLTEIIQECVLEQLTLEGHQYLPLSHSIADETDPATIIRMCKKYMYRKAAENGSLNGTCNYYNLLIKELMSKACEKKCSVTVLKRENDALISEIRKYIDIACKYHLPAALTDAATLALHKNRLNTCLEDNGVFLAGKGPVTQESVYDLVYPYALQSAKGRQKAIAMLKEADAIPIPLLQSPWPSYYLAELCLEDLAYEEAYTYSKKADEIATNAKYTPLSTENRKKIKDRLDYCKKMR